MAFKSIIDIDVNDEKFSEFLSKFEKFSKEAKEIPEPFRQMDKKIGAAKGEFGRLGSHLKRHMRESAGATKDFTVELHHAGQRMATLTARVSQGRKELSQMGETGRKTFGIIARAGKDLFKAIPFVGGAIAGAGLAAVALYQHQSNAILNRYKNAKFLGMTPGQVSAIDTQYQGVLANPAASLAAMRQAEFTPASYSFFARAIGTGWRKMNQTQMFDAELKKAKHIADHTPRRLLGKYDEIYAFNKVGLGVTDLELLRKTRWSTLNADIANAHKQAAPMNFSKQVGRTMTNLAITISQKEVELSTDLSRVLAKGAPLMNTALNKLVNSVNWAANRINAALGGVVTGKAPTHGQGPVLDTMGKWYQRIHNPMDIEAFHGDASYLNPGNGIRYAKFASNAQAYQKAARLVQGYGLHTLAAITQRYTGSAQSPAKLAEMAKAAGIQSPTAHLSLSNPDTLARIVTALRIGEQPTQRSDHQLYSVIKRAIVDGMREGGNGTPAHNIGAQIHMAAH